MIINDSWLTLEQVFETLQSENSQVELSENSLKKVELSRAFLEQKISEGGVYYGINTGFGALYKEIIPNNKLSELQTKLIRSHACGVGDYTSKEIVRLMLLTKIKALSLGYSGVTKQLVERLVQLYNYQILPVVYDLGSLGASGDLSPLSHLSLPLIGEGEVWDNNQKVAANSILQKHNLSPLKLSSKEGLALINGTQFMLSYGVFSLFKLQKLKRWANIIAAISIDAFDASIKPFNSTLMQIRQQKGQIETAEVINEILKNSELQQSESKQLQDPYSFRCIPQVHGAFSDMLQQVSTIFERELNAVTDNPTILVEENEIVSGGNFHGEPLAIHLDAMAIAASELASISERRTFKLISGQRDLPVFLVANPGINSGFMIPQYTAASMVSQNKQYSTPASVDTIDSSNGQEDHVSMGANSATKLYKVVKNVEHVLAIELLTAIQALEFRKPKKSSPLIEKIVAEFRNQIPFMNEDRWLHKDISLSAQFIQQNEY